MSSIREGKVLLLSDLPPELISRRELRNHFSAFGTIDHISLDKKLGNCLISFSSYSDALNAKQNGKLWNNKTLNIYWDRKSSLDPRSNEESEYSYETNVEVVDTLWSDDDKECFGIDEDKFSRAFKNKRQKTFNDLISSHLKPVKSHGSGVKKQLLGSSPQYDTKNESEIKRKEGRIPVIISETDVPQNVKQVSEGSDAYSGESVLKRKIKQRKVISSSNIIQKRSLIKTRLSQRLGESVLKKQNIDVAEMPILEEHGDHFIERKIVQAMETSPSSQIGNKIKQIKSKLPLTKKTGILTKFVKKTSTELVKPSKLTQDIMVPLKNRIASSLKEKYNLLDERDKILRKLEIKDSNVKTAIAMKGTCPDMCPEKERIMRSFQRLVSVYEMGLDTNEMDELLAVKEYSRSSADQYEPLSHELRPEPVLTMTMTYLINNIINRVENPEENVSEWYNFCWDRLRGIRKDIIQQQLCNLQAVEIIEQCARFHIFCYDYLWGMDVSIFDDKINIENLMNCLQTLMHMYEDLSKHGIYCPNEAEFNAYMIVLKLNSGDILWEYQSYSSQVRSSPFIKAAVDLYNAYNSKICIRFFNIVKKSPYLLACLSHRFFSNIRTSALETIAKAYTPGGKVVILPLQYIKSILKFDSVEDAVMFCEGHGIFLSDDKQEFRIKKNSFYKPESVVYVKSFSSIIRRMRLSPAQAVVGENNEIPKYTLHEVHSSFNSEGKLKQDALDASDQSLKVKELFLRTSSSPLPQAKNFESVFPAPVQIIFPTTKDISKPTTEKTREKFTFKFELPKTTSSEEVDGNTLSTTIAPVSQKLITRDVFKTPDNSFVEQDVLQIPIEELPQDLYDPFYESQGNHFSDIQAVEIDAERVEEMYQDVKKYYEDVDKPGSKLNESGNKDLNFAPVKENEHALPVLSKSSFSFTLKDKENISGNSDYKKSPKAKDLSSKSPYFKLSPEIKTKPVFYKLEFGEQHEHKNKLEEEKESIAKILEQQKKELELQRLQKAKKEIEIAKREMEAKKRKEMEEAKLLNKLKKDLRERLKVVNARFYAKRWKEKVIKLKRSREDFPMLIQLSVKDHLTLWGSIGNTTQPLSLGIVQRLKQRNTITNVVNQVLQSGIPNSVVYCGDILAEQLAKATSVKLCKKGNFRPIFWKLIVSIPDSVNEDTSTLTKLIEIWCTRTFYKNGAELGSVQYTMTSLQVPVYICVHLLKNLNDSKLCSGMSSLMFIIVNQWETPEQTVHRFTSLVKSQNSHNSCFVSLMKIGGFILEEKLKENLIACKNDGTISDWKFLEWSNPNCISQSLKLMAQHVNVVPEMCAAPIDFLLKEMVDQFFSALSADHCCSFEVNSAACLPNNIIRLYNICIDKLKDILISSKLEKYSHFPLEFKQYVSQLDISGGIEQFSGCHYDRGYKIKVSKLCQSLKLPELTDWPPKSCNSLVKMLKSYCNQVKNVTLLPQIIRIIDIEEDRELNECLLSVSWLNIVELWAVQNISYQISYHNKNLGKKMYVLYNKHDFTKLVSSQWWLETVIVLNTDLK